jgi:outer membrane scaffolding protein for murein synthesis (MipA/OmpV family)
LARLFEPEIPEWRAELGLALVSRPLYEGAQAYRELAGPVVDVRYRDLAFASVGEGIGVNLLGGDNYRMGVALGYDLGRLERDDLDHLKGLGNIGAAAVPKAFISYAVSKQVPLVLRADVRRSVGGSDGLQADVEAYLPLPGSSKTLIMFAGPSVTVANRQYLQREFGVTAAQALASGHPEYDAHAGLEAAGFGFSATRFVGDHWLVNIELAGDHLLGSAAGGPVIARTVQGQASVSVAYQWGQPR